MPLNKVSFKVQEMCMRTSQLRLGGMTPLSVSRFHQPGQGLGLAQLVYGLQKYQSLDPDHLLQGIAASVATLLVRTAGFPNSLPARPLSADSAHQQRVWHGGVWDARLHSGSCSHQPHAMAIRAAREAA